MPVSEIELVMIGKTSRVLLWKHFVVRCRRFIHTPVEFFSPIILIVILFANRDTLLRSNTKSRYVGANEIIQRPEPYLLQDVAGPASVAYYPQNNLTDEIMSRVHQSLGKQSVSKHPDLPDRFAADKYAKSMDADDAIVIFEDMAGPNFPARLNYTIRTKNNYQTHLYKSLGDTIGPHTQFGSIYEPFMRLQWAIDSSFIELLAGEPIKQRVTMQEFPYVEVNARAANPIVWFFVKFCNTWSLLLPFIFMMTRLQEERDSGIQELMKMTGVTTKTLFFAHFLNVFPGGLVYSIVSAVLLTYPTNPIIMHTNGFVIWLCLFLYFVSVLSLAFVASYAIRGSRYAVSVAALFYLVSVVPRVVFTMYELPKPVIYLTGFVPHVPAEWLWENLQILESFGTGISLDTMFESRVPQAGSIFLALLFYIIQSVIFFGLTWYLSMVCPGTYGNPLPWNFFCLKDYWRKNTVIPDPVEDREEKLLRAENTADSKYFETPPQYGEVGIEINNVSKEFRNTYALDNISMKVYRGEITVLLGHNGAGKTTLMSIITGMFTPSKGNVVLNGYEVKSNGGAAQKVGFCPQHNLFFPDLTVIEHVKFFSLLKNVPWRKVSESTNHLLKSVGLYDKRKSKSSELSGGMKRRLQLACALAGDADVLVLDEPTSGLDVETRRGLWNLLLGLRANRTVLLSTHFMEEADALGDRVAALHGGKLRSYATPMFLKREIDTGYKLSITLLPDTEDNLATHKSEIEKVVLKEIPKATQQPVSSQSTATFNLPAKESPKFPRLFSELEGKKTQLGINTLGVVISTLEEVFIKLCSDTVVTPEQLAVPITDNRIFEVKPKVRGFKLYSRQFLALWKRQAFFIISKKISFIILQVLLPILSICLMTYLFNDKDSDEETRNPSRAMDLSMYNDMENHALMNIQLNEPLTRSLHGFEPTYDVAERMIEIGKQNRLKYNKYTIGVELDDTTAKALYTTTVHHAAPIALNSLSNLVAASMLPNTTENIITTMNEPSFVDRTVFKIIEPKDMLSCLAWALVIGFVTQATFANSSSIACGDLATGTRHIHMMSGCAPELHWAATLLFHLLLHAALLLAPVLLAAAIIEQDHTIDQPDALAALAVVLLVGCLAFLALAFFISFGLGEKGTTTLLIVIIIVFGLIGPMTKVGGEMLDQRPNAVVAFFLAAANYVLPPATFTSALIKTTNVARINAICTLNRADICNNGKSMMIPEKGFDAHNCCTLGINPRSYFTLQDDYSALSLLLIMIVQCIVYMTFVIFAERGVFNMVFDKILNKLYKPEDTTSSDEMVEKEKLYVKNHIDTMNSAEKDTLLISGVHKRYKSLLGKTCAAVKGVSLSIHKGECFGLIGVNGAGKSSAFKMMTCEEFPTRGRIVANNHSQKVFNNGKFLNSLGYCPQFFGLDYFLTGRQNLELLLTLSGRDSDAVKQEAQAWVELIDLSKAADRCVSGYSGGMARRLGTAAALARQAPLTLLDEPTAGVDVAARRHLWRAINVLVHSDKNAVLVTSHSMDEMEALCARIGILQAGRLAALGAPAELRARHRAGLAVALKIASETAKDTVDGASSPLNNLKKQCIELHWTPKDMHATMLHYQINKEMKVKYSEIFAELEKLKATYPSLIEDYTVTETTLEQVFLSYAKPEDVV